MRFLLALIFASTLSFADTSVKLHLTLSPTGSFTAESTALEGTIIKTGDSFSATSIKLDLNTIKTGIDLRDKHMKENYFEINKGAAFRYAVLESASGQNGRFKGQLKVHGKSAPIEGSYSFKENQLEASFKTTLNAFDIKKASYMGVGVDDEVSVSVSAPTTLGRKSASLQAVKKADRKPATQKQAPKKNHSKKQKRSR